MVWKDIEGYEGYYQINNIGEVVNVRTGKILKPGRGAGKSGYYLVSLWKNNKGQTKHIHRMLAELFIPNPNNLPTVNHKDGNKLNNDLSNLEWASYSENNKHAYENGLKVVTDKMKKAVSSGAKERNKKGMNRHPVVELDVFGKVIKEYPGVKEVCEDLKVSRKTVKNLCSGKETKIKNKILKYKEAI